MATTKNRPTKGTAAPKSARASVSFPTELYDTLERIAKVKKVSVAWIVRDAAERYVGEQWPLFDEKQKGHA